jgi:hypothetical protein
MRTHTRAHTRARAHLHASHRPCQTYKTDSAIKLRAYNISVADHEGNVLGVSKKAGVEGG